MTATTPAAKAKTKYSSRNLSTVFKAPLSKALDHAGGFHGSNRMLVLKSSALSGRQSIVAAKSLMVVAPAPINTPSLRKENNGQDVHVNLVPTGKAGWGCSSPTATTPSANSRPEDTQAPREVECTQSEALTRSRDTGHYTKSESNVWGHSTAASAPPPHQSRSTRAWSDSTSASARVGGPFVFAAPSTGRWGDDAVEQDIVRSDMLRAMQKERDFPQLQDSSRHSNDNSYALARAPHDQRYSQDYRRAELTHDDSHWSRQKQPPVRQAYGAYSLERRSETRDAAAATADSVLDRADSSDCMPAHASSQHIVCNGVRGDDASRPNDSSLHGRQSDGHDQSVACNEPRLVRPSGAPRVSFQTPDATQAPETLERERVTDSSPSSTASATRAANGAVSRSVSAGDSASPWLGRRTVAPLSQQQQPTRSSSAAMRTDRRAISARGGAAVAPLITVSPPTQVRILKRDGPKMLFDPKTGTLVSAEGASKSSSARSQRPPASSSSATSDSTRRAAPSTVSTAEPLPVDASPSPPPVTAAASASQRARSVALTSEPPVKLSERSSKRKSQLKARAVVQSKTTTYVLAYRPVTTAATSTASVAPEPKPVPAPAPTSTPQKPQKKKKKLFTELFAPASVYAVDAATLASEPSPPTTSAAPPLTTTKNETLTTSERSATTRTRRKRSATAPRDKKTPLAKPRRSSRGQRTTSTSEAASSMSNTIDDSSATAAHASASAGSDDVVRGRRHLKKSRQSVDIDLLKQMPEGCGVVVLSDAQDECAFAPESSEDTSDPFETVRSRRALLLEKKRLRAEAAAVAAEAERTRSRPRRTEATVKQPPTRPIVLTTPHRTRTLVVGRRKHRPAAAATTSESSSLLAPPQATDDASASSLASVVPDQATTQELQSVVAIAAKTAANQTKRASRTVTKTPSHSNTASSTLLRATEPTADGAAAKPKQKPKPRTKEKTLHVRQVIPRESAGARQDAPQSQSPQPTRSSSSVCPEAVAAKRTVATKRESLKPARRKEREQASQTPSETLADAARPALPESTATTESIRISSSSSKHPRSPKRTSGAEQVQDMLKQSTTEAVTAVATKSTVARVHTTVDDDATVQTANDRPRNDTRSSKPKRTKKRSTRPLTTTSALETAPASAAASVSATADPKSQLNGGADSSATLSRPTSSPASKREETAAANAPRRRKRSTAPRENKTLSDAMPTDTTPASAAPVKKRASKTRASASAVPKTPAVAPKTYKRVYVVKHPAASSVTAATAPSSSAA